MTAIVGILNKHAAAIAADSAATVNTSSGHKVINSANKIITLSKYHPVAVMIYNSASFIGTPWDVIIKIYRDEIKDKDFETVSDYVKDFIGFLKDKKYFSSEQHRLTYLSAIINGFYRNIEQISISEIGGKLTDETKPYLFKKMEELLDNHKIRFSSLPPCEGLLSYTIEQFDIYTKDIFDTLQCEILDKTGAPREMKDIISEAFFALLKSSQNTPNYSGLVFVGYGKSEFFPSLIPIDVSFPIEDSLKYSFDIDAKTTISEDNRAAICPFAQTDVIETVLTGINPSIQKFISGLFSKSLSAYSKLVSTTIKAYGDDKLAGIIGQLELKGINIVFNQAIDDSISKQYVSPLVDTVAYLEKEDMAEMAESLISLTYLKRRMTSSEETVGGPVDVAIISKSDGFIWIKRKHYFKSELNPNFFSNYKK